MRIRTGFHLVLVVGGALVAAAVWALTLSLSHNAAAMARNQTLGEVFVEGMQLVQLTNEVLIYRDRRAVEQWRRQSAEVDQALAAASTDRPARALIGAIDVDVADMKPLFEALVAAGDHGEVSGILSSQLFQKAAHMQSSLRDLEAYAYVELDRAYGTTKWRQIVIFGTFTAAFLIFAVIVSVRFHKSVLRPIQDLERTIRLVNAGQSQRRIAAPPDDEIGVVGQAFNGLLDQQDSIRRELQATADRFRATFEQAAVGICHVGLDGRWLRVNRRLCEIAGCGSDQETGSCGPDRLLGGVLREITHPDDVDTDADLRRDLIAGRRETYAVEKRLITCTGTPIWTNLTVSLVRDATGMPEYFIIVFEDISARKAAEQEIAFLAYHDVLTRLPNRLLVRDRFGQATAFVARSGGRVATIFLDLDNFKAINDSLGHPVGDALLRSVAERLQTCLRDMDTVSRQGGDEFLITLVDIADVAAITGITDKLLDRLSLPFEVDGHELSTTASMGIAIYPDDSTDFDTLLKKADVAMYQAKAAGRNTYRFFTEQMNADASDRLTLRNGLRRAIERAELVLHYQPQTDLASGAVVGMEALLRWQHPDLGLVSPGRFIPVAEDSGLIVPIGAWVIREACRQTAELAAAGWTGLTVAVNLSAMQFKRGELDATVQAALAESGLPAGALELELTESMLISDTDSVLAMVRRLKAIGLKLSIDDFGTGYSSLAYLKRFNVDRLKIDQSFVRDLAAGSDDAAIVRAIVQLARSLDLRTIAEGVESREQLDLLRGYGCDEVQGYYLARPMPAAELVGFLADSVARAA
jgi:diguanylate cyclase (GGDEF)-like protein/PAS domain S-box-containing protein